MRNKPIRSPEDAYVEAEFKKATTVNKDALFDNLVSGTPIPEAGGSGGGVGGSNESALLPGMSMGDNSQVFNAMYKTAQGVSSLHEHPELLENAAAHIATNPGQVAKPEQTAGPQYKISARQLYACQKFPALVSFLGTEKGENLAKEIAGKVNELLVENLGENAKAIGKFAHSCVADRQNIKQFYIGDNNAWVCQVVANGPFRGDEAIYYNEKDDKSYVLRLRGKEYEDVSDHFNVIHERAANKEVSELPAPVEEEPKNEEATADV